MDEPAQTPFPSLFAAGTTRSYVMSFSLFFLFQSLPIGIATLVTRTPALYVDRAHALTGLARARARARARTRLPRLPSSCARTHVRSDGPQDGRPTTVREYCLEGRSSRSIATGGRRRRERKRGEEVGAGGRVEVAAAEKRRAAKRGEGERREAKKEQEEAKQV